MGQVMSGKASLAELVPQMNAGFQRRKEAFVDEVFEKHKCPNRGGIFENDLDQALEELGINVSPSEREELFHTNDLNKDGCIDASEFRLIAARVGKVEEWASSLPLAQLLADCMPLKNEADPVRAVSVLSRDDIKIISTCFMQGLTQLLEEEVDKLNCAFQAMEQLVKDASQESASSKFTMSRMSCGHIEDFHGGLSDRIGDPFLDFDKAMEAEHCHREDSKTTFETSNYGIETCAHDEWHFVVRQGNKEDERDDLLRRVDMREGRTIPNIDELVALDISQSAKLRREEVIAVVLYTGPMYEKYNCMLRRWPVEAYKDMTSKGSTFTTTIHVLVSAVQKLASIAKVPDGLKLYRGLNGMLDLPESFFKAQANGGRGFTEWGFMSTTSDKQVAIRYSSLGRVRTLQSLPMLLELGVGAVDRGACIKTFSQYPDEVEYLWVPCSFIAPAGAERMQVTEYGVVRIVPVSVNSNLTGRTLEQLLESKKHTHLAAFSGILQELRHDLSLTCTSEGHDRLKRDPHAMARNRTCEGLIESIMQSCNGRYEAQEKEDASMFANDEAYRRMVIEMLDVKTLAKSKLWLWLDNQSSLLFEVQVYMSLRGAHRNLLAFLKQRMQSEDKDAKRQTAVEICKLKGLIEKSVYEKDDLDEGGNKLDAAAGDGVFCSDLELLIQAGGLLEPSEEHKTILSQALAKSAEFGHPHCMQVLVKAGADVGFNGLKNSYTPLHMAALNGHMQAIAMLLEFKADINGVASDGRTPLSGAALKGHAEAARVLLEAKADVNAADSNGATPLLLSALVGHVHMARVLIEAKADVNAASTMDGGTTPLLMSAHCGHMKVAKVLIEAKADVNAKFPSTSPTLRLGTSPLLQASKARNVEMARVLLEAQADVDAADSEGVNARQLLVMMGMLSE